MEVDGDSSPSAFEAAGALCCWHLLPRQPRHEAGNPSGCILASLADVRKIELLLIKRQRTGNPIFRGEKVSCLKMKGATWTIISGWKQKVFIWRDRTG